MCANQTTEPQIIDTKTDGAEKRNRQIHSLQLGIKKLRSATDRTVRQKMQNVIENLN